MAFGVETEVPNTRVILRQPDVIVNRSLIPIQPVAEFALSASYAQSASYLFGSIESASYATFALTASYVSGAASTWDDISSKPNGLVSSSIQVLNYNIFATTGSNTFTGNQTFLAGMFVSGLSASAGITGSLKGNAETATSASISIRSAIQSTGSAPQYPITNELWYDNDTGKTYIYYVSASVGQWVLQSDPTYDPGPSLQNLQDVTDLGSFTNNAIAITNATPSTSKITGALIVSGGLGVGENVYAEKIVATQISGSIISASAYVGQKSSIIYVIDGGGLPLQTGVKGDLYIPFDCTVTEWVLLSDQVGNIVVDVWSDTYGNYPPTNLDSIAGTDLPTLSSTNKNKSTALTGWNKNILAGNTLRFNLNSISSITRVTLTLNVTKT